MISEFRRLVIYVYKQEMHGREKFHKKYLLFLFLKSCFIVPY